MCALRKKIQTNKNNLTNEAHNLTKAKTKTDCDFLKPKMWVGSNPKSKSKGHRAMVKQVVFFPIFINRFLRLSLTQLVRGN